MSIEDLLMRLVAVTIAVAGVVATVAAGRCACAVESAARPAAHRICGNTHVACGGLAGRNALPACGRFQASRRVGAFVGVRTDVHHRPEARRCPVGYAGRCDRADSLPLPGVRRSHLLRAAPGRPVGGAPCGARQHHTQAAVHGRLRQTAFCPMKSKFFDLRDHRLIQLHPMLLAHVQGCCCCRIIPAGAAACAREESPIS